MPSKLTILNSFFLSAVKKLATSMALVVTIVLMAIVNFSSNFYFLIILLSKVSGCLRYSFFPFSLLFTSFKPNTLGPIMTSTTQYYHHQWHHTENMKNSAKYWKILRNTENIKEYWKRLKKKLKYTSSPLSTPYKPNTFGPIMTSTTQYYHHQWHCQYSFWEPYPCPHHCCLLPMALSLLQCLQCLPSNKILQAEKHQNDIKGERHRERSAVWARRG